MTGPWTMLDIVQARSSRARPGTHYSSVGPRPSASLLSLGAQTSRPSAASCRPESGRPARSVSLRSLVYLARPAASYGPWAFVRRSHAARAWRPFGQGHAVRAWAPIGQGHAVRAWRPPDRVMRFVRGAHSGGSMVTPPPPWSPLPVTGSSDRRRSTTPSRPRPWRFTICLYGTTVQSAGREHAGNRGLPAGIDLDLAPRRQVHHAFSTNPYSAPVRSARTRPQVPTYGLRRSGGPCT